MALGLQQLSRQTDFQSVQDVVSSWQVNITQPSDDVKNAYNYRQKNEDLISKIGAELFHILHILCMRVEQK